MKVLIVDDDPLTVRGLENWLRHEKHEVCWAASGEKGFVVLETEIAFGAPCDVAIVDINLGDGIDGVEFCRRLRRHPEPRIKAMAAIILTGDTPSAVHQQIADRALAERDALLSVRIIVQKPPVWADFAAVLRTIQGAR